MAKVSDTVKAEKELNRDDSGATSALVPVRMLKSDAAQGLRTGEIRGVSPEVAARLIEAKAAEAIPQKEIDAAKNAAAGL